MQASNEYDAFISYSHADRRSAMQLQHQLERFRVPRSLVGIEGRHGPIPKQLGKIFLDRTDLSAGTRVKEEIDHALQRSKSLVALCSSTAALPESWVNWEINRFREIKQHARIYAVIVRDDPPTCFPPALLSTQGAEPLAADFRPTGDGPKEAVLKLAAGLLGVDFDQLRRRRQEAQRRRRRFILGLGLIYAAILTAALVGVTISSFQVMASRSEAIAEQAKLANEAGRHDRALLLAAAALPSKDSLIEPFAPAAAAQATRALLANRLEVMNPSGANLMVADAAGNRLYLALRGQRPVFAVDSRTREQIKDWRSPPELPNVLAISTDGNRLAFGTKEGFVLVIRASDGEVTLRTRASDAVVISLSFSRDGALLVAGSGDRYARILDIETGNWISQSPQHHGPVYGAAFSFNQQQVLSGSAKSPLIEWNPQTGAQLRLHAGASGNTPSIRSAPQSPVWVIRDGDSVTLLSNDGTQRAPWKLPEAIHGLSISPDEKYIAAASWHSNIVYIGEVATQRVVASLKHPDWVWALAFLNNSMQLATIARDGNYRVWKTPLSDRIRSLNNPPQAAFGQASWISESQVVVATSDLHIYDINSDTEELLLSEACPKQPASRPCWVTGLHSASSSNEVLFTTSLGRVSLLNLRGRHEMWRRDIPGGTLISSAFSSQRGLAVVRTSDGIDTFLDTKDGSVIATPKVNQGDGDFSAYVGSFLSFSPSGAMIAEGALKDSIEIYADWHRRAVKRIPTQGHSVVSLKWTPDGRRIGVGTAGNAIHLHSATGASEAPAIFHGHTSWPIALSFSPDSRHLLSTSSAEQILWDVESVSEIMRIPAEPRTRRSPVFSPDGRQGPSSGSFSDDGAKIVSTDYAGYAKVLSLHLPKDVRTTLCTSLPVNRTSFNQDEMRELRFLSELERTPCNRPGMLSWARVGKEFTDRLNALSKVARSYSEIWSDRSTRPNASPITSVAE